MGRQRDFRELQILTPREGQLLQILIESCNIADLSRQVGIAPNAVRQHLRRTKNKLKGVDVRVPSLPYHDMDIGTWKSIRSTSPNTFPNFRTLKSVSLIAMTLPENANGKITTLVEQLKLNTRSRDWVGAGPDETFLVILPGTHLDTSKKIALRLRQNMGLPLGIGVKQWDAIQAPQDLIEQVIKIAKADSIAIHARRSLYGVQDS